MKVQVLAKDLQHGDRKRLYHHARCSCCDRCDCGRQTHVVAAVTRRQRKSPDGGLSAPDPPEIIEVVYSCGYMMGFYLPEEPLEVGRA